MDTLTIKSLSSKTPLSKSKFIHGMQCPMWLFLEIRTDAPTAEVDAITQARFDTGNAVGELARQRYDLRMEASDIIPGILISENPREHTQSVAKTAEALAAGAPMIYEAAFNFNGVKVRVDILERLENGSFVIKEVKSTGKFDHNKHGLDVAVQLYALKGNHLDINQVKLVHLNKEYEWLGGEYDLEQLFIETDVTDYAVKGQEEIALQVENLLSIIEADEFPKVEDSVSCTKLYECPYMETCPIERIEIEHPISELPGCRIGQGVHKRLTGAGFESLLDIDKETALREMVTGNKFNERWYNTWKATVEGSLIITDDGLDWLGGLSFPIYHLDFETINPTLPVITRSHPFEQIPLQYSIHIESKDGSTQHREFLADASDPDPRKSLLEQLIADLGSRGTILQYSSFEAKRLERLAQLFLNQAPEVAAILGRIEDLGQFVNKNVFHKNFHGKWSIKTVYPVLISSTRAEGIIESQAGYNSLEGVASGDEASLVLLEYRDPKTTPKRREEIRIQLLEYCSLDTHAMVEVLSVIKTASTLDS